MLNNIYLKTLRDNWRSIIFWAIGLVALAALYTSFYPSVKESSAQLNDYIQKLPPALKGVIGEQTNYATPTGYISGEVFSIMYPLIFFIYAIGFANSIVASEEEKGTLDLLLANPIPRWRLILEKFLAMLTCTFVLFVIAFLGVLISTKIAGMDLNVTHLAETMLALFLLSISFGSITLAVGAAFGKTTLATGLTAVAIVVSFFVNALSPIAKILKDYREFSPFYHYFGNDPLTNGVRLNSMLLLVWISLVFLVIALWTFNKRDLSV